jgi:hypothetical protein
MVKWGQGACLAVLLAILAAGCGSGDSTETDSLEPAIATPNEANEVVFALLPVEAANRKGLPAAVDASLRRCEAASPSSGDRFACLANYFTDSARRLRGAIAEAETEIERVAESDCTLSARIFLDASEQVADALRATEEAVLGNSGDVEGATDSLYREVRIAGQLDRSAAVACR